MRNADLQAFPSPAVGSHLEAQVVLQFGGSHVGLSTLACTCSDQQNGINQSGQRSSLSTA